MRICFLVTTLLFSNLSFSQNQFQIEGKVTDASDQTSIPGASVFLPDLKRGAITSENGQFTIAGLPRGKFLMEVKFIGYAPIVMRVDVPLSQPLSLSLSSTITELNEIVISGISHSTELKKNPISVTTLSREAIVRNNSTNIIDNLSQRAGVSQITTGVAISKPLIRGLGFNRIITLYDGIRQEGQQWGDEHGIEIDEYSVDRVEIVKGAGSLMYGSDGIGGVINLLAPNPVREGVIEGEWISNYQSNNGLISNSLLNAGNLKGFFWNLRGSQKIAGAYRNAYDGRVFNSGFREFDVNLQAGINRSWGYSQFNASSFNQNVGLIEGERDSNGNFTRLVNAAGVEEEKTVTDDELTGYKLFLPKQTINHFRLSSSTNIFSGDTRFQFNAAYQQNVRREFGDVLAPAEEELLFDLKSVNYSLITYFPEWRGWNFSIGAMGMYQQNRNRGEEFLIPEYNLFDLGVVSFWKKTFNKLDVAGGLRYDTRRFEIDALYLDNNGDPTGPTGDLKFAASAPTFSNYSASAGVAYQFSETFGVKANISRGFRAPTVSELSSNGRHEGSLRYEYGNLDLKAESSLQADLSFHLNSDHVSSEVSLFQNRIDNYIFTEKLLARDGTDSIPDPSEPVPAYRYTQGIAVLQGGEFTMDIHPHPLDWLHVENSFSFVLAENKSGVSPGSRYLPFIPAPRFQSELRANARKWKSLSNLFVRIQYQYNGSQHRVYLESNTETTTPGYSLWSAGAGFELKRKERLLAFVSFSANNIFDVSYQNHLSRLKYAPENPITGRTGVLNPGRNYSLKLVLPFTFRKETTQQGRLKNIAD